MEEKYLIESVEHTHGDNKTWWKPNRMGYTVVISRAGRYTREEAQEICARANHGNQVNEIAWQEADVLNGKAGMLAQVVLI